MYERYVRTFSIEPARHADLPSVPPHELRVRIADNQTMTLDLTQGELLDLWQVIGRKFNLMGMADSFNEARQNNAG
jgi:hypothetical protein